MSRDYLGLLGRDLLGRGLCGCRGLGGYVGHDDAAGAMCRLAMARDSNSCLFYSRQNRQRSQFKEKSRFLSFVTR
jgi:hypothetical protein